jgi:hypothetical protein
MDRGRIIDKVQNQNARFIDNFGGQNKTSVKTSNPPGINKIILGGKSSFSLGWSAPEENVPKVQKKAQFNQNYEEPQQDPKTNVRVNYFLHLG